MTRIRVKCVIEPKDEEIDHDHPMGLTNEAWEKWADRFQAIGAEDVEFVKDDSDE